MPPNADSTSLYRRHRPGSFDEVVGQQHVVRTLRNAVEADKVHHAYLFVGSRGTGKTSMAKILARSLNCERGGPTVTPCGECESCLTIAAGSSVDVIEMDAASNRSVDDIRELRERVAYAPAGGRWKVYILDEAHMLTKEAWNAFLKTLEEPPPNTVFVLATTESHKVMATIADRCQRFDFQRPSLEQIAEVVNRVAAAEGIEIDRPAVAMIARSASGSFRDALGTLDQLVAYGGARVELDSVLDLLGAPDAELIFGVVDAVAAEDPKGVLLKVDEMARSGRDPVQFARDLLAHLRHLLVTQTVGEVPETFVVTAADTNRLAAQAAAVGAATLVRTIDELAAALTAVREGDEARMAVEIALLKAARPDLDPKSEGLLRRVERLEKALSGGSSGELRPAGPAVQEDSSQSLHAPREEPTSTSPAGGASTESAEGQADPDGPPSAAEGPEASDSEDGPAASDAGEADGGTERESSGDDPAAGGAAGGTTPEEASATGGGGGSPAATGPAAQDDSDGPRGPERPEDGSPAATGPADLDLSEVQRIWPAVLDHLRQSAPAFAATFENARPVGLDEDGLTIGFPPSSTFNKRKAEDPERRELVGAAFEAVAGRRVRPAYVVLDGEGEEEAGGEEAPGDPVDHDDLVQRLKSEFDAEEVG